MCRQIITHCMHHDVAAAMILDPTSADPIIYANPLRTNHHRCELESQPPTAKCSYHTCCIPTELVECCHDFVARLQSKETKGPGPEPEECGAFVVEHHHRRLPYFGNEDAYNVFVPARWREMVRVRGAETDSFPGSAAYRRSWEGGYFAACETLYTLDTNRATLFAIMNRLRGHSSWGELQAATANVLAAERKLHEQRRLVSEMCSAISFNGLLNRALSSVTHGNTGALSF